MSENENGDTQKKKSKVVFSSVEGEGLDKSESGFTPLMKAIEHAVGKTQKKAVPRIALEEDPYGTNNYAGIFKLKKQLLPDEILKMVRTQNHLIASILRARANTISMFGRLKANRLDVGVELKVKDSIADHINSEHQKVVDDRIERMKKLLVNCGHTEGLDQSDRMQLDEFLYLQVIDGVSLGRFATEIIYSVDSKGNKKFHRFRSTDAGTIYKTIKKGESASGLRQSGIHLIEQQTGQKISKRSLENDEYSYVQTINGMPKQAFTPDEMIVWNLYPTNDIEYNGYPVTPIDTCITNVTSHLSIDVYNKLYFQNGRAAKGILVINSEEMDQSTLNAMKQDFYASINSTGNAFRIPVFGIGPTDSVNWMPVVSSSGDGEFSFLLDNVSRAILSSFSMSPDELPGLGHLSRGTSQQTLSESSNEFKLTAARDTGLRPLVLRVEAFLNRLVEIIDPELAQLCVVKLSGLDSESKEQEAVRLQQEMPIHMDYDEVLTQVEKEPVGKRMGGSLPFNERYNILLDKYENVGEVISEFMGDPSAVVDPVLAYKRDPFYFQSLQMLQQTNPGALKALFATKPYTLEVLKLMVQDYLEEDENN